MSIDEELKGAGLQQRTCLLIYLYNVGDQYKLRKYGDIVYFSKKMKYCVLYLDSEEANKVKNELAHLDFVERVEFSDEEDVDLSSSHIERQIADMAKEAEIKLQSKNEDLLK